MTTFQAAGGRHVELTPLDMNNVDPEWIQYLDVDRPDVSKVWADLGLYTTAGGGPTPGAMLSRLDNRSVIVIDGAIRAAKPVAQSAPPVRAKATASPPVRHKAQAPVGAPPAPARGEAKRMKESRRPLDSRPNWGWVIANRDRLSAREVSILLGCTLQAVYIAMQSGRLPRRGGGQ